MGIFSERGLPDDEFEAFDKLDFSEEEMLDLQRKSALTELEFLDVKLMKLIDRMKYYGEAIDLGDLEGIRADVRHTIKVFT